MKASRSKDRAREEFERFATDTAGDLLRTGYLVVWDLPAAEDLVQECLFRVARRWPRVRTMEYPRAYARRILVNLALSDAARRSRNRSELRRDDQLAVEEHLDVRAARELGLVESNSELMRAIGQLAPRQRAALVLRYFDDLSEAQAAEVLGCSVGTIKSTTSRALDRLRELLVPLPMADHTVATSLITYPQGADS